MIQHAFPANNQPMKRYVTTYYDGQQAKLVAVRSLVSQI